MAGLPRISICFAHLQLRTVPLSSRTFSTTPSLARGRIYVLPKPLRISAWREKRDIPRHANMYGPLADLPDWRYEDGRPGHLSRGQRSKLDMQEEYCQRISFLLNEVDSATNTHAANQQAIAEERADAIRNKLQEKGRPFPGGTSAGVSSPLKAKSPPSQSDA